MADVHTKKQRSYNMSQIRSKNTKPEMLVRSWLHKQGYRFRLHNKNLPGNPDIVLKKYRTVIFVNGCFWHGCPKCYVRPKSNTKFWDKKISGNIERDRKVIKLLQKQKIKVIIIWDHQLKTNPEKCLLKIKTELEKYK